MVSPQQHCTGARGGAGVGDRRRPGGAAKLSARLVGARRRRVGTGEAIPIYLVLT